MKVKVLDLCVVGENNVSEYDEKELFEYEGKSWNRYIRNINDGNLDGVYLQKKDVDTSVFIIADGGELIRLKDGTYLNVCWRGDCCRVWEEDSEVIDDDESEETRIQYFNRKLEIKA